VHTEALTENGYRVVQVYRKVPTRYRTFSFVALVLLVTLQSAGF